MPKRRCKVQYRKVRRANGQFPSQYLSDKIAEALKHTINAVEVGESVHLRITGSPRADEHKLVLNDVHIGEHFVFGDLCLFSPGQLQALLRLTADPDHPTLDEIIRAWAIAESAAPSGHEYLHGIAYWLAIGDHFYQIQDIAVQTKASEEYLTWLLRDQTKVIAADHYVELQAEFDRSQMGDDLGDVKSVEIGGLVPETVIPALPSDQKLVGVDVETHQRLTDMIAAGWAKAKNVVVELLGEVEAKKLFEQMPPEAALEVTVNIGYRAKRRRFEKEFMRNLASGLRNAPDGEIRIRGADGEIKGDDARLSAFVQIKTMSDNSSLLDMPDTIEQISEVHRRFLHDGKINNS